MYWRSRGRRQSTHNGVQASFQDGQFLRHREGGTDMKGIPGRVTKALPSQAKLECADNTGAKVVQLITMSLSLLKAELSRGG